MIEQIKNYRQIFLLLIPIFLVLFFPTKQYFGIFSITEAFLLLFFIAHLAVNFFNKTLKFSSYNILILGIIAFSTITQIYHFNGEESIKNIIRIIEYAIIFNLGYTYCTKKNITILYNSLIIVLYLLFTYSLIQKFYPEILMINNWGPEWKEKYLQAGKIRIYSLLDNPLNLVAFVGLILGILKSKITKNSIYHISFAYITLILTASKIAIIIIIISLIILFFKTSILKLRISAFLRLIPIAIIFTLIFYPYNKEQSAPISRVSNKNITKGSVSQRQLVLSSSLEMIKDNPVLGIGAGNFEEVYTKDYISPGASKDKSSFTAENIFLEFHLDNGLIPTIIYILMFIYCIYSGIFSSYYFQNGIAYSFIFVIITGMVTSLTIIPLIMTIFLLFGIQLKLNKLQ